MEQRDLQAKLDEMCRLAAANIRPAHRIIVANARKADFMDAFPKVLVGDYPVMSLHAFGVPVYFVDDPSEMEPTENDMVIL